MMLWSFVNPYEVSQRLELRNLFVFYVEFLIISTHKCLKYTFRNLMPSQQVFPDRYALMFSVKSLNKTFLTELSVT